MGEVETGPTSASCNFCLDTETHGLICVCPSDCGLPDCANAEKPFWYRPAVPRFGGRTDMPKKTQPIVPVGVVNIDEADYGHAINRVVELHKKCECKGCSTGAQRPACVCCNDFWPCITIRTIRHGNDRFLDSSGDPVPA